jgi:predicted lipid carrier protein YhbT
LSAAGACPATVDPTAGFFEALGRRGRQPLLDKVSGTIRVDLVDQERTVRWFVSVTNGDVAVSHRNAGADCVVRADKQLFDAIVRGEVNAIAALLRGALALEGSVELLVLFQRLFPGPARGRTMGRAAGFARRQS